MIRIGTIEEAYEIFLNVPELDAYLSLQKMKERLADRDYLVAVAEHDGVLIGFKIGYKISDDEFYSWLGGVIPIHRQFGVAQTLLDFQESWVRNAGLKYISVKSMNRFPSMLRLLIKNGYKIKNIKFFDDPDNERIEFIKTLN